MIEKAAAGEKRPEAPRALLISGLAALVVVAITGAHAGAPYLFTRATLQSEVATQVRETTGLAIETDHARFDLLPRPHVTMAGVHVADASGSLLLDADRLSGDVRLLPLIVGRIELSAITLRRPRLSVDLDGRSIAPDSTIGRALQRADPSNGAQRRLGSVTIVDGTITLKQRLFGRPYALSNVDATVDWRDLDAPATITGSLQIDQTPADVAGWVAQPSSLMRGGRSTVALRIHSTPLDFTATGDLSRSWSTGFKGHVMASAPSLDGLLALYSRDLPLPAPFANVTLSSDASVSVDDGTLTSADLHNLNVRADGNSYEGTIAYTGGRNPLVSGTLATDQLVLAPFVDRAPRLLSADRTWSRTPFAPVRLGAVNLDLRISGAHLRLAPLNINDAALSLMTRGDRLEIALNEGKAYGGSIKGRASLGFGQGGLSLRAAGTLADADLATLTWDAFGWQAASGTLSGSANLESEGQTPAALMAHLQGWAKGRASDGEISGFDLRHELQVAGQTDKGSAEPIPLGGRTAFSSTEVRLHIAGGNATVERGDLSGASAALTVAGVADLAKRALALHASMQPPNPSLDGNADGRAPRTLRFGVTGNFDHVVIAPEGAAPRPPATAKTP